MKRFVSIIILSLCIMQSAVAALSLELTQGVSAAMPIGLIPFKNEGAAPVAGDTTLSAVMHNDLQNSGQFHVMTPSMFSQATSNIKQIDFKYWQKRGVNYLIIGQVTSLPFRKYKVAYQLLNVYTPKSPVAMSQTFTATHQSLRGLAHHIGDLVYQKLTGVRGIFSTRIAYVLVQDLYNQKPKHSLEVADADGFDPHTLLVSTQPIMSPTWTDGGRKLAYVSFEKHHASIYLQDLATGKRRLVSHFPGINSAPAFSPDGSKLAMVLSTSGNPKIYMFDMKSHRLTQLTHGYSIDTEPSWAPDGKSFIFTSDRGRRPQIYRYYLAGNRVERVTFDGNYNARASFLPDGKGIIMMHRETDLFGIAKQDLDSGFVQSLTDSGGDESPSVAPNGKMVIYAKQDGGHGVLALVSTDGRIKLRLPSREGNVQEPAWSPFLHG